MAIWHQAVALISPLCILGCSSTDVSTTIADVPANIHTTIADAPVELASSQPLTSLSLVPPNGLDSLDEADFRYFQTMGPMEYATRLGGLPEVPTWRVRLRLYPSWQDSELLYRVKVDHYNLSPALYDSLVSSYGEENTDPRLNDSTPHQHVYFEFLPVMNVAADWLSESTQISQSDVTTQELCGLGISCTILDEPIDSEWSEGPTIDLETAPWPNDSEPLPMLVRTLARQAGWLQDGEWMLPLERPEGLSDERPWVEVLVTNYAGNGGGYMAHWIERVADDSVQATVHRLYSDAIAPSSFTSQGYMCARGAATGQIRALCP